MTPTQLQTHDALLAQLRVMTVFVTTRCNARCETCFYWDSLNDDSGVMGLAELERVARTMPKFPHLLLSGGEPFMRKDLVEVVSLFKKHNDIKTIDSPTNGLWPDQVEYFVEKMLTTYPDLRMTVGVSLDGLEKTHDRLRAVPGNFKKAMETLNRLSRLRDRLAPGVVPTPVQVLTLTCYNTTNMHEMEALTHYITEHADVDGMMFEVIRGNPKDPNLQAPPVEIFDAITRRSIEVNSRLYEKRMGPERDIRISYLKSVYWMQRQMLVKGRLPLLCRAGINLGVLEPKGDVRLCELLESVGNVKDFDYDFGALWHSERASKQRKWITDSRCSCTHCVNIGHSIGADFWVNKRREFYEYLSEKSLL